MTYYGISVIITIIVTSVIAFYFLYKAKELNLGILISITAGSIVLGFSFSPTFRFIMELFSDSANFDKKFALLLSLIVELLTFLLLVCILSFVISMVIPNKFASIDCGVYIDKFFESAKNSISDPDKKGSVLPVKIINLLKENVKNAYNLKNKLKKPVDTSQIIDTMDLEKNENGVVAQDTSDPILELNECIDSNMQEVSERVEAIQASEEIQAAVEEVAAVQADAVDVFDESEEVANTPVLFEETETEIEEFSQDSDTEFEAGNDGLAEQVDDSSAEFEPHTEEISVECHSSDTIDNVQSIVDKAFELKGNGRRAEAIEQYMKALEHNPDNDMLFWIVLDVCTLYKQLGLSVLAQSILEGIVEKYGAAIKPEIKEEINKNLK